MELKEMADALMDIGVGNAQTETVRRLFESGQTDELVRHLKKCRCSLLDEMHESQKKVDLMDYLIRRIEKDAIKPSDR